MGASFCLDQPTLGVGAQAGGGWWVGGLGGGDDGAAYPHVSTSPRGQASEKLRGWGGRGLQPGWAPAAGLRPGRRARRSFAPARPRRGCATPRGSPNAPTWPPGPPPTGRYTRPRCLLQEVWTPRGGDGGGGRGDVCPWAIGSEKSERGAPGGGCHSATATPHHTLALTAEGERRGGMAGAAFLVSKSPPPSHPMAPAEGAHPGIGGARAGPAARVRPLRLPAPRWAPPQPRLLRRLDGSWYRVTGTQGRPQDAVSGCPHDVLIHVLLIRSPIERGWAGDEMALTSRSTHNVPVKDTHASAHMIRPMSTTGEGALEGCAPDGARPHPN